MTTYKDIYKLGHDARKKKSRFKLFVAIALVIIIVLLGTLIVVRNNRIQNERSSYILTA